MDARNGHESKRPSAAMIAAAIFAFGLVAAAGSFGASTTAAPAPAPSKASPAPAAGSSGSAPAQQTPRDGEMLTSEGLGKAPEASIPFVDMGSIRDWRADGERGIWVQGTDRRWYYGQFLGPCTGLRFTNTVGFDTGTLNTLDRFGSVVVPGTGGGRCALRSFTSNEGPAPRGRGTEDGSAQPDAARPAAQTPQQPASSGRGGDAPQQQPGASTSRR